MSEKIQAMRNISQWIEKIGWKVYYNQKNLDGYPTFTTMGSSAKPDIMATNKTFTILIEVKSGKDHQDILDGFDQVIKYAGEYYTGRIQYKTNITQQIDAFVLATGYSLSGYLYGNEGSQPFLNYTALKTLENMVEKPITHTVTRLMWRTWHKGLAAEHYESIRVGGKSDHHLPNKPLIGVLIARTTATPERVSDTPWLYLNSNKFIPIKEPYITW